MDAGKHRLMETFTIFIPSLGVLGVISCFVLLCFLKIAREQEALHQKHLLKEFVSHSP